MPTLVVKGHIINTPLINILQDAKSQARNGKLSYLRVEGKDIICTCPHHKGGKENKPSCGVYIGDDTETVKYGDFNCFTCGAKGSFSKFISECFNQSEDWAKDWLVSNYGDGTNNQVIDLPEMEMPTVKKRAPLLSNSILNTYQSWHPYMEKRKLSRDICKQFDIKYDPQTGCLVFPVRDTQGQLLFLTRRSVYNKTFIIPPKVNKPIYLLNEIIKKNITEVIVCESQINALYTWSMGYAAVATFGCNITDTQFDILNKSPIRHYYLALDGDDAGRHGTQLFLENINPSVFVDVMILPEGKDVNDLSPEEFDQLPIISGQDWLQQHAKNKNKSV